MLQQKKPAFMVWPGQWSCDIGGAQVSHGHHGLGQHLSSGATPAHVRQLKASWINFFFMDK